MSAVDARLAMIAQEIGRKTDQLDALGLHADLMAIERAFRHTVLPWSVSRPVENEGDAS